MIEGNAMTTRRSNDSRRTAPTPPSVERSPGSTGAVSPSGPKRPARRRSTAVAKNGSAEIAPAVVSSDARRAMIAEAAYLRAERRAFVPGFEEEDWLTAEREVDALLSARHSGRQ
jgi:Protein of unknown function (DUF2934)